MTLWPSCFAIASAMMREETSEAPPAANGTISVMLRSGHFWASAGWSEKIAPTNARCDGRNGTRNTGVPRS